MQNTKNRRGVGAAGGAPSSHETALPPPSQSSRPATPTRRSSSGTTSPSSSSSSSTRWAIFSYRRMLRPLLSIVTGVIFFAVQFVAHMYMSLLSIFPSERKGERIRADLRNAKTYTEFVEKATELDKLMQTQIWQMEPKSTLYDYKLINHRLQGLIQASNAQDVSSMIWLLRSGLIRNLGGICDPRLYTKSYLGSKKLITRYIDEVISTLEVIADKEPEHFGSAGTQAKSDFFSDIRQSFGSTALVLQGGASFGLFHLGVVKALYEHKLLPRIISGSSIGALTAALVCIRTENEIPTIFEEHGIDLRAFTKTGYKGSITRKIQRFLKHGYLMDVKILEDCVRMNIGDITFEEAYRRTGRILNIVVSSKRKNEIPRLLNYLTAPNVLIWSAACASAAVVGLYDTVDLLAKDKFGNIVHWSPSTIKWSDATFESDSPEMRLAELFNVNHFILSQASPIMAPLVSKALQDGSESLWSRLGFLVMNEVRHRVLQLGHLGLLPRFVQAIFDNQRFQGNVTIAPHVETRDFYTLFSNPTYSSLQHWILKGEQSTWPFLFYIKNRCAIELALDRLTAKVRGSLEKAVREESGEGLTEKKRTKSVH